MSQTPINDFLKAIQAEFGEVAYKATSADGRVVTKNWITNKFHPANRPNSDFVVPILELHYNLLKKKGKK